MTQHYPLMITGAVANSAPLEVRAPYDQVLIATIDANGEVAVEKALDTAYGLFRDCDAWLSPARRIEILRNAARLMQEQAEHLATEAAREGGKPLVDSRVEVSRAIDGVVNCAELLRSEAGRVVPMNINAGSMGRIAFTQCEPVGVVVAVSAFNHRPQFNRPSGRFRDRRRLPSDRQTCGRHAPILFPLRRNPTEIRTTGRMVPGTGYRPQRADDTPCHRSSSRLLQLHRQCQRRLDAALASSSWHSLRA
jgi:aldehyde dehydrogenase family protein